MLHKLLEHGFGNSEDYNCAEKIIYGANQAYHLNLDKTALKLSAGFGGGMGIETTCGALSASVMVLSHIFVSDYAHESSMIKLLTQELFSLFHQELKEINCAPLKTRYRTPELQCSKIILTAAKALDSVIDNHKK